MSRITYAGMWTVPNLQSFRVKVLRGGANRLDIELSNVGLFGVTYTIQDIVMWQTRLDQIMQTIPAPETGMWRALNAFDFIPMHDGTYINLGGRGGNGVLVAGSLVNNNPFFNPETNATYQQLANGYIRIALAGQYASYDGPWTIGFWIYPTLVSAAAPIYYETNAAVTHYMQIFLDTDRRIGFRMSNVATTFSIKDGAGPQVPLNQWSLIFCNYSTPNFTYIIAPNSTSAAISVGAGGMATFSDANVTYFGLISGANGWIAAPFSFNTLTYNGQTTDPLSPAMRDYIFYEWQSSYNALLTLDTGSLSGGGNFIKSYGVGTPNPFPPVIGIQLGSGGAGDTRGYIRVTVSEE